METTIAYWGNVRIMEKKMETTIVYCLIHCWLHRGVLPPILADPYFSGNEI